MDIISDCYTDDFAEEEAEEEDFFRKKDHITGRKGANILNSLCPDPIEFDEVFNPNGYQ